MRHVEGAMALLLCTLSAHLGQRHFVQRRLFFPFMLAFPFRLLGHLWQRGIGFLPGGLQCFALTLAFPFRLLGHLTASCSSWPSCSWWTSCRMDWSRTRSVSLVENKRNSELRHVEGWCRWYVGCSWATFFSSQAACLKKVQQRLEQSTALSIPGWGPWRLGFRTLFAREDVLLAHLRPPRVVVLFRMSQFGYDGPITQEGLLPLGPQFGLALRKMKTPFWMCSLTVDWLVWTWPSADRTIEIGCSQPMADKHDDK